jgi:hypothetical protein
VAFRGQIERPIKFTLDLALESGEWRYELACAHSGVAAERLLGPGCDYTTRADLPGVLGRDRLPPTGEVFRTTLAGWAGHHFWPDSIRSEVKAAAPTGWSMTVQIWPRSWRRS